MKLCLEHLVLKLQYSKVSVDDVENSKETKSRWLQKKKNLKNE